MDVEFDGQGAIDLDMDVAAALEAAPQASYLWYFNGGFGCTGYCFITSSFIDTFSGGYNIC